MSTMSVQLADKQPMSLHAGNREQQEKMLGNQPGFCIKKLRMENCHLLGSWFLAFQKPQPAFPATLARRLHSFSASQGLSPSSITY